MKKITFLLSTFLVLSTISFGQKIAGFNLMPLPESNIIGKAVLETSPKLRLNNIALLKPSQIIIDSSDGPDAYKSEIEKSVKLNFLTFYKKDYLKIENVYTKQIKIDRLSDSSLGKIEPNTKFISAGIRASQTIIEYKRTNTDKIGITELLKAINTVRQIMSFSKLDSLSKDDSIKFYQKNYLFDTINKPNVYFGYLVGNFKLDLDNGYYQGNSFDRTNNETFDLIPDDINNYKLPVEAKGSPNSYTQFSNVSVRIEIDKDKKLLATYSGQNVGDSYTTEIPFPNKFIDYTKAKPFYFYKYKIEGKSYIQLLLTIKAQKTDTGIKVFLKKKKGWLSRFFAPNKGQFNTFLYFPVTTYEEE